MVGEAFVNPVFYETGTFLSDNESLYSGFDNDLYKSAGFAPLQDTPSNSTGSNLNVFGSADSGAFNMVFCDGSVHHIAYEIDAAVFSALGSRAGDETIEGSQLDE